MEFHQHCNGLLAEREPSSAEACISVLSARSIPDHTYNPSVS